MVWVGLQLQALKRSGAPSTRRRTSLPTKKPFLPESRPTNVAVCVETRLLANAKAAEPDRTSPAQGRGEKRARASSSHPAQVRRCLFPLPIGSWSSPWRCLSNNHLLCVFATVLSPPEKRRCKWWGRLSLSYLIDRGHTARAGAPISPRGSSPPPDFWGGGKDRRRGSPSGPVFCVAALSLSVCSRVRTCVRGTSVHTYLAFSCLFREA